MTRVAAVDIGTNSTRLLVADVEDESVRELDRRLEITRLGEGVDERRILLPRAIARVRNVLAEYRRAVEEAGAERALAFATSAVRDAENGEAFLGEVEWSYGFRTALLSGDQEALLTFRGVSAGREVSPRTIVIDVGGGSTELILGSPESVSFHTSLDLGCVRLTERHGTDLDATAAEVRSALPALRAERAVNVDGTTAELAALTGGRTVTLAAIDDALAWIVGSTDGERRARLIEPDRSDVLAAGVVVVRETLRHLDLNETTSSDRDLLNGVALAAARLGEPAEGDAPPGAYTCC